MTKHCDSCSGCIDGLHVISRNKMSRKSRMKSEKRRGSYRSLNVMGDYEKRGPCSSAHTTRLRPLATETACELEVLRLDGDTLGVDRGKVGWVDLANSRFNGG